MTVLKSFHRTAYEILPYKVIKDYKGQDLFQIFHFYNDNDIFFEFFKCAFQPGSTAIDCGLNFGLHTDMFLSLGAKKVVAFEASREVLKKVTKKYSGNQSVKIIGKALKLIRMRLLEHWQTSLAFCFDKYQKLIFFLNEISNFSKKNI